MNKTMKNYAMALMLGMGFAGVSTAAHATDDISVFADIGGFSNYVWRGSTLSNQEFSIQGDAGVEHESGVSANVWFATLGSTANDTEYDLTLDYSGEAGDVGYSVGFIRYDLITNPAAVNEVYVGGSFGIASATYYRDITNDTNYFEVGAGYSVEDVVDLGASVGFTTYENATLSVSKDFEVGSVSLSGSLVYAVPLGSQKDAGLSNEVAVGLNASF